MRRAQNAMLTWPALLLLAISSCSSEDGDEPESAATSDTKAETSANKPASSGTSGSPAVTSSSSTTTPTASASSTTTGSAAPGAVPARLTVSGPVEGGLGKPFTATAADLAASGYSEKEFFFEGAATSYELQGEMSPDGKWSLKEGPKAAFKSRLLVRRPKDASKFNGTVVVEWLNVSGGADGDPGFMYNADEILREGYAYVGVSAQAVGVVGGGLSLGAAGGAKPLKQADPERYGTLNHPGDGYSFDIYGQAGKILRDGAPQNVLEGLKPERLIAYGESQSAMRMVSYVNGVHPLGKVYDGYFIHSRSAGGVPFGASGGLSLGGFGGGVAKIRDDIDAKVFQFQTETDVTGMLGFLAARQPDTDKLRTWEVAGTAHADQYLTDFNAKLASEGAVNCPGANNGPQPFVIRAALHALNQWLVDGTAPAHGEVLATNDNNTPKTDEHGNTQGGVRSPAVDVPISTLSGAPAAGSGDFWCFLFGSTTPFSADKLKALYPTHDDYVKKVEAAARKSREAGFLLEPEEKLIVEQAKAAPIPE